MTELEIKQWVDAGKGIFSFVIYVLIILILVGATYLIWREVFYG